MNAPRHPGLARRARARSAFLAALAAAPLAWTVLGAAEARAIPCLSGFVRDAAGQPVANGDLDFNLSATGQRIVTPGDNTDGAGFYTVCVLQGTYDVAFAPPAGTRLLGRLVRGVDLTADVGVELDVTLQAGSVLSGAVRDGAGQPVGLVDIDVDQAGVGRVYTPDDSSDPVTGAYRVVVPDGLHRVRWSPPRGSRLRGLEADGVTVSGDRVLDAQLEAGLLLTGRVTDAAAQGLFDVAVDLRRLGTGEKVFLSNGDTDAAGDYTVAAPAGSFQLRFVPPRASSWVAAMVDTVEIAGDVAMDRVLATGRRVVVEVRDAAGLPLAGADLDVTDPSSGAKLFTPHDTTDESGQAVAVLPEGAYDLDVSPPPGSSLVPAVRGGVVVDGDELVVIQLEAEPRVTVGGRVLGPAAEPVGNAVFRLRRLSDGAVIALGIDATAADGTFALDVPRGAFEVLVAPPAGSRLLGLRLPEVTVSADSLWGDLALAEGFLLEVSVSDAAGAPVAGADLDVAAPGQGALYTPRDNTGADGRAVVAVPAGDWDLLVTPPPGSGLRPATLASLVIAADTSLSVTLEAAAGPAPAIDAVRPNPATGPVTVSYSLPVATVATVTVHDLRGRLVATLASGPRSAGGHESTWDGKLASGGRAAAGVYLVRLATPAGAATSRLALLH